MQSRLGLRGAALGAGLRWHFVMSLNPKWVEFLLCVACIKFLSYGRWVLLVLWIAHCLSAPSVASSLLAPSVAH